MKIDNICDYPCLKKILVELKELPSDGIETSEKTMTAATNKSSPKMIMKVLITKVFCNSVMGRFVDHAQTFH